MTNADGSREVVSTEKIASLASGAVVSVKSALFKPKIAELGILTVEIDTDDAVQELEENNNSFSKKFLVERYDLASGKKMTASSGNAERANDADIFSIWQATAMPATLTADLGEEMMVSRIRLSEPPNWATPRDMTLDIVTSRNGADFIACLASKNYSIRGNAPVSIDFPAVQARYIRLNITASKPNMAELSRFQVYGDSLPKQLNTSAASTNVR